MSKDKSASPPQTHVRPHYLVDQLIEAIQKAIDNGSYKPGERLPPEVKLSSDFGVGRSTVREALRVLSHQNRIETRTGSGSYVVDQRRLQPPASSKASLDEVEDIYAFRFTIEARAAELAASRRTQRQMKAIRKLLADAKRHLAERDIDTVASIDTEMHIAILEAGGLHFAADLYRGNRLRLEVAFKSLVTFMEFPDLSVDAIRELHDALIEAIENGDDKAAIRAVNRDRKEVELLLARARRTRTSGKSRAKQ